jgi:hypothetical protein
MDVLLFPGEVQHAYIPMGTGYTVERFKGVKLEVIDCDGFALYLKGDDGRTYVVESNGDEKLQCRELACES